MGTTTWLVAEEYDEDAFKRLEVALRDLGYGVSNHNWNLSGSQEVSEWNVSCPSGSLQITAETYIGLTVTGPEELVADLQDLYHVANTR